MKPVDEMTESEQASALMALMQRTKERERAAFADMIADRLLMRMNEVKE